MFQVLAGDCREVMATLEAESVDAIVTDPPYELGFMGKSWDASGVAFDPDTWRHALRVLKPGGHLLAFSGSRTYHRMACAIEDAGFEIRDQIMWVYGSGFPKSHDVSKAIDREAGAERETKKIPYTTNVMQQGIGVDRPWMKAARQAGYHELAGDQPATEDARTWSGWGTALKPAHEPIVVARKPFKGTVAANVLAHGTGALNIDGCRVGTESTVCSHRASIGYGGSKVPFTSGSDSGRWPANLIHDGSDEVMRLFPDAGGGSGSPIIAGDFGKSGIYGRAKGAITHSYADAGSAARFFYCAKASKRDREDGLDGFQAVRTGGMQATADGSMLTGSGNERTTTRANHHPTVKPTDLMRYLCRLITPPGGLVLDPFTGSGSTGRGAVLEGFRFIGIEMDAGYREIAIARIESAERSSHGAS